MGQIEKVMSFLENIEKNPDGYTVPPSGISRIYAAIGASDKTFEWLDRAYKKHDFFLTLVKITPEYDKYKTDPRYIALLKKMGLSQ